MPKLTPAEERAALKAIEVVHQRHEEHVKAGDTLDEQLQRVRDDVFFPHPSFLRRAMLHALGLRPKRGQVDNLIIMGCMSAFGQINLLMSYMKLLDHLGVSYTFIKDTEYCCGSPLVQDAIGRHAPDEETQKALTGSKEFMAMNVEQGKRLGVKNMAYFCQACAYQAKYFFPEAEIGQMYHLDLIVDHLRDQPLRLRDRVGYYEGCWRRYYYLYPGVEFDLSSYRGLLDRVEGLEVRELPSKVCCFTDKDPIFRAAERNEVSTIVTPCAACYSQLERVAVRGDKFKVKMVHEIILEAIEPHE